MDTAIGEIVLVVVLSLVPWLYFAHSQRKMLLKSKAETLTWQIVAYSSAFLSKDQRTCDMVLVAVKDEPDWYGRAFSTATTVFIANEAAARELEQKTAPVKA